MLAGPVLEFFTARGIYRALARRRRDEELHGREIGRVVMSPQGGYSEIREPARRALAPTVIGPEPECAPRRHAAAHDTS